MCRRVAAPHLVLALTLEFDPYIYVLYTCIQLYNPRVQSPDRHSKNNLTLTLTLTRVVQGSTAPLVHHAADAKGLATIFMFGQAWP